MNDSNVYRELSELPMVCLPGMPGKVADTLRAESASAGRISRLTPARLVVFLVLMILVSRKATVTLSP